MDLVNVLDKEQFGKITKKVPFINGAEVTFYQDVAGDFVDRLNKKSDEIGESEAGYWSTTEIIADWNFSDGKGTKLEVSQENLKRLPMKLQKWILTEGQKAILTDDERKKESPVSSSKR